MLSLVERHKVRVDVDAISPTVEWRNRASTLKTASAPSDAPFLVL